MDILDLGTRRLSWGRLYSLLQHLPRESATARAIGGAAAAWGDTEHLLAVIADALRAANWQRSDTKKHPKPPDPLPRPGEVEAKRRKADAVAARLLAQRERTGR